MHLEREGLLCLLWTVLTLRAAAASLDRCHPDPSGRLDKSPAACNPELLQLHAVFGRLFVLLCACKERCERVMECVIQIFHNNKAIDSVPSFISCATGAKRGCHRSAVFDALEEFGDRARVQVECTRYWRSSMVIASSARSVCSCCVHTVCCCVLAHTRRFDHGLTGLCYTLNPPLRAPTNKSAHTPPGPAAQSSPAPTPHTQPAPHQRPLHLSAAPASAPREARRAQHGLSSFLLRAPRRCRFLWARLSTWNKPAGRLVPTIASPLVGVFEGWFGGLRMPALLLRLKGYQLP